MRNKFLLTFGTSILLWMTGCVQKTYHKTLVFELDVSALKNISHVGVRGSDKPLNWESDLGMTAVKKDTTYTLTTTFVTGYKFTGIKFTVNDEFELKEKGNRRVYFEEGDTTYYKAVFDNI
ncbi:MAG: hypothetical protein IPN29_02950 [Saprospiraceae bacterium]|nr:hypothetical protein [Saprospiraceae bacterium]